MHRQSQVFHAVFASGTAGIRRLGGGLPPLHADLLRLPRHRPIGQLLTDRGAVGVDIFFVISGLVIYLSTRDKTIARASSCSTGPCASSRPTGSTQLLMAMLLLAFSQWMPHQVFDWQHLFLSLLFIPAENPGGYGLYPTLNVGWTLNFEMFFYLLFGLAFLVRQRHHLLLVTRAVAGQRGAGPPGCAQPLLQQRHHLRVPAGHRPRRAVPPRADPPGAVAAAGAGRGGLAIYHLDASSACCTGACRARWWCWRSWPGAVFQGNRLLKALGDCSYSVYLIHVLVLYAGWFASQRLHLNPYLVFALCVPSIGLMSWFSYQWLERGLYRRMQAWLAAPGAAPEYALSRVKY
jgi:peptidoglycan/LPS O-acetylase OafA/YrhL